MIGEFIVGAVTLTILGSFWLTNNDAEGKKLAWKNVVRLDDELLKLADSDVEDV